MEDQQVQSPRTMTSVVRFQVSFEYRSRILSSFPDFTKQK